MGQIGGEPVGVRLGQHEGHHLLGDPTAISGKGLTSGLQEELPHPNVSKPHFVCFSKTEFHLERQENTKEGAFQVIGGQETKDCTVLSLS